MTVYHHWDPLLECVVGKGYPPEYYSWIQDIPTRKLFEQLAIETEEDLQQLVNLLEQFGVVVIRPTIPSYEQCILNDILVPPPVQPRDHFIQIQDKLWVCTTPNKNFARNAFANQDILTWSQFQARDQAKHDIKLQFYQDIFHGRDIQETELSYISGCFVSRLGKNLYFATQTIYDDYNQIQREVDALFPNTSNTIVDAQGHGDAVYCPVTNGLIISIADEDYKNTFPGWEIVHLDPSDYAKHNRFMSSMKLNAGKWYIPGFDKNPKILGTVDQYFNEWVGEAHETVFGVNILIINPTNVVIAEYNKRTVDALERYGITAHISPFRHKYFWDAGIHCLTNDLRRTCE